MYIFIIFYLDLKYASVFKFFFNVFLQYDFDLFWTCFCLNMIFFFLFIQDNWPDYRDLRDGQMNNKKGPVSDLAWRQSVNVLILLSVCLLMWNSIL